MTRGVAHQARNRWPGILAALGVDESYLNGKHGPCPWCGGKDRFRFTDWQGKGSWICNQCGAGDGFDFLANEGMSFAEAAAEVEKIVGYIQPGKTESEDKERVRRKLVEVQKQAKPAGEVHDVVEYLRGRGLETPPGLYACPEMPYYEAGKETGSYPVMLGKVVDPTGQPVTWHRTYLSGFRKAPVDSPRKAMKPCRPMRGSAIRLYPADEVVAIAEGIETAIAFQMLWRVPTWSVVNATLMREFVPPEGIKHVIIAGDCDANYTGQAAAYECARRLAIKGYHVDVEIPPEGDWDDERRKRCN